MRCALSGLGSWSGTGCFTCCILDNIFVFYYFRAFRYLSGCFFVCDEEFIADIHLLVYFKIQENMKRK